MIVEVITGLLANSLALLADAGHMLNDIISLAFSLIAIHLSTKKSNSKFTFGYKRVEVFSGLINGFSLIIIAGYIIKEAFERLLSSDEIIVEGALVIGVGFVGLLVNIVGIYILESEKEGSINIEGAYQHIMADLLGSVAALIAGVGIVLFGAYWLDAVASVAVSALILKSGISISKRAVRILIEATPEGADLDLIISELKEIHGVVDIHDFHAWRVTDGFDLLTAHVIVTSYDMSELIKTTAAAISRNHGFNHSTFQIEQDLCAEIDENC
jgi:cobalt-zinc-cadmium efflux system protein